MAIPNNVPSQPQELYLALQNDVTGQIDYLKFVGSTLVSSNLVDYGLSGWDIVGHGDFDHDGNVDLVAQSRSTGQLDFLFLDPRGNLERSALSNVSVPKVVGVGFFGGFATGSLGNDIVSQLPDGSIDILGFNGAGTL